jgi:hypothetical protein
MEKRLGSIPGPNGPIIFSMEGDRFLIGSVNRQVAIEDEEFSEVNGHLYANIQFLKLGEDFQEIMVPDQVLELKTKYRKENALSKNCVVVIEHPKGKIYISISSDCKIFVKMGEKTVTADKTYFIEGKRALYVPELELDTTFLEVPDIVEEKLKDSIRAIERGNLCLIYAGKSLLNNKYYYKLSCNVDTQTWYRIRDVFQWFGEDRNTGGLSGWLTAIPELVEQYLYLKTPSVANRETEIDKQKIQAEKKQEKIVQAILKSQ